MSSRGQSHPALRADGANTTLTIMSYLRLTSSKNAPTVLESSPDMASHMPPSKSSSVN
ncbi:hypothetical protein RB213_010599 [Colletotrichum asianum]